MHLETVRHERPEQWRRVEWYVTDEFGKEGKKGWEGGESSSLGMVVVVAGKQDIQWVFF